MCAFESVAHVSLARIEHLSIESVNLDGGSHPAIEFSTVSFNLRSRHVQTLSAPVPRAHLHLLLGEECLPVLNDSPYGGSNLKKLVRFNPGI